MSKLSPESWKALGPHLDRALDLPADERAHWLETLSAEDPALAAQLRDLLEEHRMLDQERFLEHPPVSAFMPSPAGARVGAFQILHAIGEGGMGTVWLAQRVDGEVQQNVAIKLLRPSNRPTWRDRFLKERQFLASLNHSAIARLLDAGQREGQPYLVMEFVDGVPIDVYAASRSLRDKIALFLKVCDGVSHAHRRLIVHRDLKPSNILVDNGGQPKLLDFGIAKLLDETGDATQTIERVLTPNYASPEQFRGETQTVATDIYSLGAVLYKLLTGSSPHESAGATPSAGVLPTARELTPPSRLQAGLPGDFDAILSKALRAEPDERYVSVDAFAEDLRAFLNNRPVNALSGNRWYRARKFLQRRWIPLAAAAAVAASLSGGAFLANRQQAIAQRRFTQVRQLANRVLALDKEISALTGATKARQDIASMTQQYLEALSSEASDDQQLTMEIITSYIRLASVQGVPTGLNLGQYEQADQSLRRAEELVESLLAKSPSHWPALSASLEVAHGRMILADSGRRHADALIQARKAAARAEQVLSMGNPTKADHNRVAERYANIALCLKNRHLYAEAVRYAQKAFDHASGTRYDASTLVQASSIVADAKRAMGDLEGSYQSILETRQILAQEPPQARLRWVYTFSALWREGLVLGARHTPSLGRTSRAIDAFQRAFDLIEETARHDPNDSSSRIRFASAGRELGDVLQDQDPQRALAVYDHAILRLSEVKENAKARRGEAELHAAASYPLRKLKRFGEAKRRIEQAFTLLREVKTYPAGSMDLEDEGARTLIAQAEYEAETGQTRRAAGIYDDVLSKIMAAKPDPEGDLRHASGMSNLWGAIARLEHRLGDTAKADDHSARRLQLWDQWNKKLPNNAYITRQLAAARNPQ